MVPYVASVNLGSKEANPAKDVGVTGFGKRPVPSALLRAPGAKHVGLGSGLVGDFIGDVAHHGGDRQAVYAFAREELDSWEGRLGRELPNGSFGENLTTSGVDVDAGRIGDRWTVGDEVVLEVTGPRIPCATFAHRMGVPGWLSRFSDEARTGAYLAVVTGGVVRAGDAIHLVTRAEHEVSLRQTFRAFMGDLEDAAIVLASGCLPDDEQEWLRSRVARRTAQQ